ncbi:MAG: hypothetical protein GKC05_06130 [Methanomicrobiales archaeon]|nr:hypothetical protein [Methanomicrobiales archaeon]NYT21006.1 hypothetical protein [Methanomicrobiales archaeon]
MAATSSSPLRAKDEAKSMVKDFLQAVGVEFVSEFDEHETWGFWVKFGEFPILIENPKGMMYVVVAFQITLSDSSAIAILNEFYAKQDNQAIFELTRIFTSPHTGFTRIIERGQVIGFTIMKNVYPYHPGFTVRDMDEALQAVVSVGDTGIAYLKALIGTTKFDHTPQRPVTEPGPMFE